MISTFFDYVNRLSWWLLFLKNWNTHPSRTRLMILTTVSFIKTRRSSINFIHYYLVGFLDDIQFWLAPDDILMNIMVYSFVITALQNVYRQTPFPKTVTQLTIPYQKLCFKEQLLSKNYRRNKWYITQLTCRVLFVTHSKKCL